MKIVSCTVGHRRVQPGSLLLIIQGVFGVKDAPRKWWEKISEVPVQVGFRKQRTRFGLSRCILLHVMICWELAMILFELKLKELDKFVGFGSMKRRKFDQCGRQYEKHPNGEITISMKAYIQNLEKVCVTRERMKQLDDELSATESHEFRGINRFLHWVTEDLLYLLQSVVKVLQRRQGETWVRDLIKDQSK